jgi:D-aminopeptidase
VRAPVAAAALVTFATWIAGPSGLPAQDARAGDAAAPARTGTGPGRDQERPRARDVGVAPGSLEPGPLNAITDVAGVLVGHVTVREGGGIRSGVTVVLPHGGDPFRERVPAALHVGNGFGKLVGATQLRELGELETPIALTCTLCVWNVANGLADWTLSRAGHGDVRSVNPVVGETNDGWLNDIRNRPVTAGHAVEALGRAAGGRVEEGAVGAGTGTVAFGWKGGIGTSSRRVEAAARPWTVGVLVQTNYGGDLTILGVPVARELAARGLEPAARGRSARGDTGPPPSGMAAPRTPSGAAEPRTPSRVAEPPAPSGDGSVVVVVATDAPLDARQLERLARRAILGVARTGSVMSHGSGDYVIAFSTAEEARRRQGAARGAETAPVGAFPEDALTPLFQAAVEATEEAIYNSLFKAVSTTGNGRTVEALPIAPVLEILRARGAIAR